MCCSLYAEGTILRWRTLPCAGSSSGSIKAGPRSRCRGLSASPDAQRRVIRTLHSTPPLSRIQDTEKLTFPTFPQIRPVRLRTRLPSSCRPKSIVLSPPVAIAADLRTACLKATDPRRPRQTGINTWCIPTPPLVCRNRCGRPSFTQLTIQPLLDVEWRGGELHRAQICSSTTLYGSEPYPGRPKRTGIRT
jgi:hypothetical protein